MVNLKELQELSRMYEEDLREFRLSNDLKYLLPLINAAMRADRSIAVDDFYKELTNKEREALSLLTETIGLSGNISIVKMEQKGISRPVWHSLFQKMEKYGVAIIKNQGVKGTHIELMEELCPANLDII